MGCGATKEVEIKKERYAKKKSLLSPQVDSKGQQSPPLSPKRTIYDRRKATKSEGDEKPEPGALGRAYQVKVATVQATISDTIADMKYGKADEVDGDAEPLSDKVKKKIQLWLQDMPETPVPIVDLIIDDRPGTPEGYYVQPKLLRPNLSPQRGNTAVSADADKSSVFRNVSTTGYVVEHGGKCITVFSAPNYCDQLGNKGAFIRFKGDPLEPKFTTFPHVPHSGRKPMQYSPYTI